MNKTKCKVFIPRPKRTSSHESKDNEIPTTLLQAMNQTNKLKSPSIKPFTRTRNYTGSIKVDSIFSHVTRLKLNNNPKPIDLPKISKHIPISLSKENLLNEIKSIEYINKPMNKKLESVLKEEEIVIAKDHSKTNNFSFDFDIFGNQSMYSNANNESCNEDEMRKEVYYLSNYSKIIRNKISNESKAQHYIQKLRHILKAKENQYEIINQLLNKTIILSDENKIKQSLEIDAHLERMNNLHNSIEDKLILTSSSKNQISDILNESKEKTTQLIKEIDNIYTNSKENEIITKNREKDLRNYAEHLHFEIKTLKKEIQLCIKTSKEYYIDLLKKGNDTRNEGVVWIVRRLLQLEYVPLLKDFPSYYTEESRSVLISIASKQNENFKYIEQLQKIRKDILTLDSNKQIIGESIETNIKKNLNAFKKNNENYLIKKMEELLIKHDYCHVTPYQEDTIKFCLETPNINQYRVRLKQCSELFKFTKRPNSVKSNKKVLNKIFNKKYYNFAKNEEYKLLKTIIDIKQKIKDNEYEIDRIKSEHLDYIYKNNLYNYELLTSLFGNANKYKYHYNV